MAKTKLSNNLIEGISDFEKEAIFFWYRGLSRKEQNELLDKYETENPLSNGCVLKIHQAENQ